MDYSDTSNVTLTDSISESYVTAIEDDDNGTRFLSILESTNEISLEDISFVTPKTGGNEPVETAEEVNMINISQNQPFVFSVAGSDDIYGIQLAEDSEGNLQKYQFQYKKNEDNELVPMLDTVQILPLDADVLSTTIVNEENEQNITNSIESDVPHLEGENHLFLEQAYVDEEACDQEEPQNEQLERHLEEDLEGHLEEELEEQLQNQLEEHEDEQGGENYSNLADNKTGILEEHYHLIESNLHQPILKQELLEEAITDEPVETQDVPQGGEDNLETDTEVPHIEVTSPHYAQNSQNPEYSQNSEYAQNPEYAQNSEYAQNAEFVQNEEYIDIHANTFEIEQVVESNDEETEEFGVDEVPHEFNDQHYEQLFVEENHVDNEDSLEKRTSESSGQEESDFEIVDGMHITGDLDNAEMEDNPQILQEAIGYRERPNVLGKLKQNSNLDASKASAASRIFYIVNKPEKENLDAAAIENFCQKPYKNNPRSVLKTSVVPAKPVKQTIRLEESIITNKRFYKSKQVIQARMFNNFINCTTVPIAPVRKERLPRKQTIKPVERSNEDIVVEEVMVSTNGIVESVRREVDKLPITDYVVISDSDDGIGSSTKKKKNTPKKNKSKSINRITVSDSEDSRQSDQSVIEINNSDEEFIPGREKPKTAVKRRRGRSSQTSKLKGEKTTEIPTTVTSEADFETPREIQCSKCSKTFPSQNSMKTHLQHHTLENNLKKARKSMFKKPEQKFEYKHKCDVCDQTFKNNILLGRHNCPKKKEDAKKVCAICNRHFQDEAKLNSHKKTHMKERLVKSTVTAPSPKRPPTSPEKPKYSCAICGRNCHSQNLLNSHVKNNHKTFTCSTCAATFTSKMTLDVHIRQSCVKSKVPNKRLSFKIRKSFRQSPRRLARRKSSIPVKTTNSPLPSTSKRLTTVPSNSTSMTSKRLSTIPTTPSMLAPPLSRGAALMCDKCPMRFLTHTKLFNHKVIKHNLDTPDKSILEQSTSKKLLVKPKGTHGGIPANERIRSAYVALKSKLEETNS